MNLIEFLSPVTITPQATLASIVFCVLVQSTIALTVLFGTAFVLGAGLRLGLGL